MDEHFHCASPITACRPQLTGAPVLSPIANLERQITLAGREAVDGERHSAQQHVTKALELLSGASRRHIVSGRSNREARKCLEEAAALLKRGESNRALVLLRSTLSAIQAR